MGTYLNPGNSGFERIVKGQYIDKTGMISVINDRIGTTILLEENVRSRGTFDLY